MITGTLGGGGGGASAVSSSAYGDMSVAGPSFFGGGMIPGYANGGMLPSNGPAIVGENGPEFVYSSGGNTRVYSNKDSKEMLSEYNPGNSRADEMSMANTPIEVNYNGPSLEFDGDQYIPRSEIPALIAAGAKKGEAMTLSRLQNSRSSRSKLGM